MVLSGLLRSTLCGPGTDFATAFIIFILSIPEFARASYNTANCTEKLNIVRNHISKQDRSICPSKLFFSVLHNQVSLLSFEVAREYKVPFQVNQVQNMGEGSDNVPGNGNVLYY